jgi:hypothetical protein
MKVRDDVGVFDRAHRRRAHRLLQPVFRLEQTR